MYQPNEEDRVRGNGARKDQESNMRRQYGPDGKALVTRHAHDLQAKEVGGEQRANLFHT